MSCVFRISGELLDIDALLAQCAIPVCRMWRKGEPRILKGKFHSDSGANFIASDADFVEFDNQLVDATAFLKGHASEIAKIIAFPGLQNAILDFAVATKDGYTTQSSYLPPKFVQLVARLEIGVGISHYPSAD
ncbi:hypothetical protein H8K32_01280 [Undibacterium jejuense]|uniref:DUF4279 domain-containing protein n=1 Tax=Undibacterium jejuense TaxID=1344949 RepID=A0A923KN11_9BURK|nr:hypothetical protein [Undibacterium jejuense]MBC3860714.1 hypothetical protein [Undibacterium jejuense]